MSVDAESGMTASGGELWLHDTEGPDGHPRPQLRRATWVKLDGEWEFAFDPETAWKNPREVSWQRTIRVPFAPESPASGIGRTDFFRACWYRRVVKLAPPTDNSRIFLRFGAVDWAARIWINGAPAGRHEGGYTPFSFDITNYITAATCEIVVRAQDDPHHLTKPREKQD